MAKNILYALTTMLLLVSAYFVYDWYKSDPQNKEPLPALISSIATIILTFIAWRMEGAQNDLAQRMEQSEKGQAAASNTIHVKGDNNIANQGVSNSNIQIHTGTGDNVQGDKKVYNIGKIDKADFS